MERMPEQFNKLSPPEHERLSLLIEECGEVLQVAGKILRHGYESSNPTLVPEERTRNRELLEKELGHLQFAQQLMLDNSDLNGTAIDVHCDKKSVNVVRWLHHEHFE